MEKKRIKECLQVIFNNKGQSSKFLLEHMNVDEFKELKNNGLITIKNFSKVNGIEVKFDIVSLTVLGEQILFE